MDPKDEHIRKSTAHHRGGAGTHDDKRTRRRRTRADRDRWARHDEEAEGLAES